MHTRRSIRLPAAAYVGEGRYAFTICTADRRRVFTSGEAVSAVQSHFLRSATAADVAIAAYCFMPDHLHLLVIGQIVGSRAHRFVTAAKQTSGFMYRQQTGLHLWQRSFWDRVLRSDEATVDAARYILANPVRAGLAVNPWQYPYSGSTIWSRHALAGLFLEETGAGGDRAG